MDLTGGTDSDDPSTGRPKADATEWAAWVAETLQKTPTDWAAWVDDTLQPTPNPETPASHSAMHDMLLNWARFCKDAVTPQPSYNDDIIGHASDSPAMDPNYHIMMINCY